MQVCGLRNSWKLGEKVGVCQTELKCLSCHANGGERDLKSQGSRCARLNILCDVRTSEDESPQADQEETWFFKFIGSMLVRGHQCH